MAYSLKSVAAAVGALVLAALPSTGFASTLTFNLAQLAGFSQLSSSNPLTLTINTGPGGGSVGLTTIFTPPQVGAQSADVGLAALAIAFAAGDNFLLRLANTNENAWDFALTVVTNVGTFSTGAVTLAAGGPFTAFSVGLGAIAGTISSVYFTVAGSVPIGGIDRVAEYRIAPPVPIPPALALFGVGAVSLGWWQRRKKSTAVAAA
jgi:hypothetical protein